MLFMLLLACNEGPIFYSTYQINDIVKVLKYGWKNNYTLYYQENNRVLEQEFMLQHCNQGYHPDFNGFEWYMDLPKNTRPYAIIEHCKGYYPDREIDYKLELHTSEEDVILFGEDISLGKNTTHVQSLYP